MMPGSMSPPPRPPGAKWPGFLINRSGLPFDDLTWNELWEFAAHLHPEARQTFREIQNAPCLQDVPVPQPPSLSSLVGGGKKLKGGGTDSATEEYLAKVQDYLCKLTYNHTGTQFFETRPGSSMLTLMETARSMVREALPVKCMEAVVLGVFLTNGVPGLGRFTVNFKSELPPQQEKSSSASAAAAGSQHHAKRYFYHVVLGVSLGTRFGSLGLSRRTNLMDKPLTFPTLSSLIDEFDSSYKDCGHRLVKVRVGRLISHDPYSISPVPWRGVTVHPRTDEPKAMKTQLDKFARELKSYLRTGGLK